LTVQAENSNDAFITIVGWGPTVIVLTDPVPDDNSDQTWAAGVIDVGPGPHQDGSGVMNRLTIVTEPAAVSGQYALALTDNAHLDASGNAYSPATTHPGYIAVNQDCDSDVDGLADPDDACITYPGPPSNNGCPLPGPNPVGGSAGLIDHDAGSDTFTLPWLTAIAATALTTLLAGGALVRLVARRARR
jgi:hypothetical protein